MHAIREKKFPLGKLVATPGALQALETAGQNLWKFVVRHLAGDWGDLDPEDKRLNDEAVKDGSRILSAYTLKDGKTRLWVITEAADEDGNRAATTLLLPEEY